MSYHFIRTKTEGHVFTLTLARPEKRNAFTPTMVNEVNHALHLANIDPEIWVVVFQAEGPVFCAGMDLNAFLDPSLDVPNPLIQNRDLSLGEVVSQLNKPSIALVSGKVVAGGFLIIAECTYVLAAPDTLFSLPEVGLGLFPFQVLASLLKIMPSKKCMQLCLNPASFGVARAMEYGLVDGLWEGEAADQLISALSQNAPLAVQRGFEALKQVDKHNAEERFGYLLRELERLRNSEDAQEGIIARAERRAPVWKNR